MSAAYLTYVGDAVHYVGPNGACHAAIVLRWDQHGDAPTDAVLWVVDPDAPRPRRDEPVAIERPAYTGKRGPAPGTCHHPARCGRGIEL